MAAVPESLLKKQKAVEALQAKRAEERVALKKVCKLDLHGVGLSNLMAMMTQNQRLNT